MAFLVIKMQTMAGPKHHPLLQSTLREPARCSCLGNTNSPESLKNSLCSFQFPQPPHRGKTLSEQIAGIPLAICFCRQTRPRRPLYPMHEAAKEAHTLCISKTEASAFRPEVLKQVLNFRQYPLYLKSRVEFWLKKTRGFDWIVGEFQMINKTPVQVWKTLASCSYTYFLWVLIKL